jgi:hypothetical protein
VQGYTDGQLKWVIDNGVVPSGMPASKGILSDEEIWSIVLLSVICHRRVALGNPMCTTTKQSHLPEIVTQWRGRASKQAVEAVIAVFRDSAEEFAHRLSVESS